MFSASNIFMIKPNDSDKKDHIVFISELITFFSLYKNFQQKWLAQNQNLYEQKTEPRLTIHHFFRKSGR